MPPAPLARAKDRPDFMVFNEIGIIAQLANARRGGAETPAQLASAFQVTKGAMTYTLQHLEAKRLVSIAPHGADGRKKLVSLTPEGVVAHGQATLALRPHLEQLREAFAEAEFDAALPFLRALRTWLDEHR